MTTLKFKFEAVTFLRIVCICSVFNKEFEIIAFITETRDDIWNGRHST